MKKLLVVSLLFLLSITLTGCNLLKNKEETIKGSFFDLIKAGKNVKCTFEGKQENATMTGTIYVSGKNARSDYEMTVPTSEGEQTPGKLEMHMLVKDDWAYTWGDMLGGMKMNVKEMEQLGKSAATPTQQKPKLPENVDFKCKKWSVDNSVFEVPTNVEFPDITQGMKDLVEKAKGIGESSCSVCDKAKGIGESSCSVCDMAPDEATKTNCRKSLGCE
jgi:predicted small secreted protein